MNTTLTYDQIYRSPRLWSNLGQYVVRDSDRNPVRWEYVGDQFDNNKSLWVGLENCLIKLIAKSTTSQNNTTSLYVDMAGADSIWEQENPEWLQAQAAMYPPLTWAPRSHYDSQYFTVHNFFDYALNTHSTPPLDHGQRMYRNAFGNHDNGTLGVLQVGDTYYGSSTGAPVSYTGPRTITKPNGTSYVVEEAHDLTQYDSAKVSKAWDVISCSHGFDTTTAAYYADRLKNHPTTLLVWALGDYGKDTVTTHNDAINVLQNSGVLDQVLLVTGWEFGSAVSSQAHADRTICMPWAYAGDGSAATSFGASTLAGIIATVNSLTASNAVQVANVILKEAVGQDQPL